MSADIFGGHVPVIPTSEIRPCGFQGPHEPHTHDGADCLGVESELDR